MPGATTHPRRGPALALALTVAGTGAACGSGIVPSGTVTVSAGTSTCVNRVTHDRTVALVDREASLPAPVEFAAQITCASSSNIAGSISPERASIPSS